MKFPEAGEIFGFKYRIERVIGSGGFSRVYLATQLDLDRSVAIKILQPPVNTLHGAERDERLQSLTSRFEREARMVSKLKSPNTINMYDYGRADDGQLFMVIEFVDGLTLSELIRQEGALAPKRVAKILQQTLLGLYEAHQLGMLHRDIKPQNIMVFDHMGISDQVKLLDFGIVKLIGSQDASKDLTSDDTLVGTPRYMSPEYIRGAPVGEASDIYSLGLVIYELLVGEQAIQANSSIQIIGKQLERDSFYLPEELNIDLPLRVIVNGMLEKNVKERYNNIAHILEDLELRADDPQSIPNNVSDSIKQRSFPNIMPVEVTGRLDAAVRHTIKDGGPLSLDSLEHTPNFSAEPAPPLHETNTSGDNKILYIAAGLTLLLVAGVIAIGITLTGNTENAQAASSKEDPTQDALAKNLGAQETPPADQALEPGNAIDPPAVDPIKAELDPSNRLKEAPKKDPEVKKLYTIQVSPAAAMITINGQERGSGEVNLTASDFPIKLVATYKNQVEKRDLKDPQDVSLQIKVPARKSKSTPKGKRPIKKPVKRTIKKPVKKTVQKPTEQEPVKKPVKKPKTPPSGGFGEGLGGGM